MVRRCVVVMMCMALEAQTRFKSQLYHFPPGVPYPHGASACPSLNRREESRARCRDGTGGAARFMLSCRLTILVVFL